MINSFKEQDLGPYSGGKYTSNSGKTINLDHIMLKNLNVGLNTNIVITGKVVGSVAYDEPVPL